LVFLAGGFTSSRSFYLHKTFVSCAIVIERLDLLMMLRKVRTTGTGQVNIVVIMLTYVMKLLVFNLETITGRTRQHIWAMRKLANLFLWQE